MSEKHTIKGFSRLKKTIKKNRKKIWCLIIILLLILIGVATVGAFHLYQHNQKTFDAMVMVNEYGAEGLEQRQQELTDEFHNTVLDLPDSHMEILNERDHRKLKGGDLTPEQTAQIFEEARKRSGIPSSEETDHSTQAAPVPTKAPAEEAPIQYTDVDVLIEQFYVLKSKYLTGLEQVIRRGKNEWRAKPKSEQTLTARFQMAQKCMAWGEALEAECDAEMAVLLAELETSLKATGQSTSLADEIRALYQEEKNVKRAMLIEEYYPQ